MGSVILGGILYFYPLDRRSSSLDIIFTGRRHMTFKRKLKEHSIAFPWQGGLYGLEKWDLA
jgi:hypothetical protein